MRRQREGQLCGEDSGAGGTKGGACVHLLRQVSEGRGPGKLGGLGRASGDQKARRKAGWADTGNVEEGPRDRDGGV